MGSPQYPTALDTNLTLIDDDKPIYVNSVRTSTRELRIAIKSLQVKLGIDSSADTNSIDYKMVNHTEHSEITLTPKASSTGGEGTIFYCTDNYVYVATE